jgi:RNA polymerase sigma factor (sigma-70 family)
VALFRAGSDDAFRAIHERYRSRLLAYARQMLGGSRCDAEDALQDVFVRAYGALRASDRPIALRAWLYRVAHNRCIDQLRRPVPEASDVFEVSRPPAHDPPLEAERREELRRLVIDVGRLPDQQRSALLMRELQGMSYEEMAAAMDVSVAAIKSLLVRARGGLFDSAQARDAACSAVRREVALACDRGVRGSGLVRRHLRDCPGCRAYRDRLRGACRRLAALAPVGPLGMLAQTVGLGGTGGMAIGAAGASGTIGGAGSLLTATKVALVCAAAVTAGTGALDVAHRGLRPAPAPAVRIHAAGARGPLAGEATPGSTAALEGPNAPLHAADTPLAPVQLAEARAPVTFSPAPNGRLRRRPATSPQFVTGQDLYPPGLTQSATGGDSRVPGGAASRPGGTTAAGGPLSRPGGDGGGSTSASTNPTGSPAAPSEGSAQRPAGGGSSQKPASAESGSQSAGSASDASGSAPSGAASGGSQPAVSGAGASTAAPSGAAPSSSASAQPGG